MHFHWFIFPAPALEHGSSGSFFPLTIAFVLLQNLFSVVLVSILHVRQAIEFAVCLLLFCLLTSLVINKVTKEIGLSIDQEAKKRKEV